MFKYIIQQGKVILEKDPAAKSLMEAIFTSPGLKAMVYHRITHKLYKKDRLFLARLISQRARRITGIEIHPGATLGEGILIDHGMGIVIGETAEVGNNVTLFHGVTLGGVGGDKGAKRHPTVEDDVIIGSGAKILGNITIGKGAKIGANAVVLHDVPAYTTAVGVPARIIYKKIKENIYAI
ncbi:serine O-acetyltransferase [Tissierella creatinini]|nr:serine O-acetyltransferase [Tissierella creatinini]TJX66666.1 serine O-acetyltransferase [Soehngenia saccharolytica]